VYCLAVSKQEHVKFKYTELRNLSEKLVVSNLGMNTTAIVGAEKVV
jgi:hypothetical protein